eukprot:2492978-Pyramimonas_sp.AAC.1
MMYYSIPSQSEPFLDEHHLPDMNDLSRIEPVPESTIDVNRDVHDMISLLPDLDDWMDQDAIADTQPTEKSQLDQATVD